MLFNSDDQLDRVSTFIETMKTGYAAGLIIVSDKIKEEHLAKLKMPIVAIDRIISDNIPSITVNNYKNAREAVRYLVQQGCSKIAHIKGPEGVYTSEERLRGYCDETFSQGLIQIIGSGNYELMTSFQKITDLLAEHPDILN